MNTWDIAGIVGASVAVCLLFCVLLPISSLLKWCCFGCQCYSSSRRQRRRQSSSSDSKQQGRVSLTLEDEEDDENAVIEIEEKEEIILRLEDGEMEDPAIEEDDDGMESIALTRLPSTTQKKKKKRKEKKEKKIVDFKCLTLNVFLRPPVINHGHSEEKDYRADLLLDKIKEYDIVCLQEFYNFGSNRFKIFIEQARKMGFTYILSGDMKQSSPLGKLKSSDSGLMFLSRFMISKSDNMVFKACNDIVSKGVRYARLEVGEETKLHVFTTHLQSNYYDPSKKSVHSRETLEIQKLQLNELANFMKTKCDSQENDVLLMGDFNMDMFRSEIRAILYKALWPLPEMLADHDATSYQKQGTLSVVYDEKTGKELATTTSMCRQCKQAFSSKPKSVQRVDQLWFNGVTVAMKEISIIDTTIPQKIKEQPSSTTNCLMLSDHFGLECVLTLLH